MAQVLAFPGRGEMFVDARDSGRFLRVTWHHGAGVAVLSLWRDDRCRGTFRLPAEDAPAFVAALTGGLAAAYSPAKAAGRGASSSAGSSRR